MDQQNVKLERDRFHLQEHARADRVALIPKELGPEDIESPAFWANVSNQCRPFERIEARAEDGTWIAELVILEASRTFLRVKRLQLYRLTTEDVAQTQIAQAVGYTVMYRGGHELWGVKRLSDEEIVHTKEPTRDAAEGWLREHLKAVSR